MNSFEVTNVSRSGNIDYIFCDLVNTPVDKLLKFFHTFSYCPWIFSLIGSLLVGLSGVFPLLVIPIGEGENLKFGGGKAGQSFRRTERRLLEADFNLKRRRHGDVGSKRMDRARQDGANRLRVLLSFAVGGLLGDVFLHLLPEVWQLKSSSDEPHTSLFSGVWVLIGMLVFVTVEKLCSSLEAVESSPMAEMKSVGSGARGKEQQQQQQARRGGSSVCVNNNPSPEKGGEGTKDHYHISGYLNLMANSVDNFTHGLTIGGSFAISFKMGVLSTFAILVHELPHEIGDFAILLKSGFSRTDAAKAQLLTAFAGIMGSMVAVMFGSVESKTSWILPFTAGGFLHIALVTVLPDLVHEESKFESCKQLGSLMFGIGLMAFVITYVE